MNPGFVRSCRFPIRSRILAYIPAVIGLDSSTHALSPQGVCPIIAAPT